MAIATVQAECALAVERTGSFRRAASELYMSQPAVSATIASLERSLGVRLFERTSSGARPTKDGVTVMPHLRAFLASQEVLLREAARLASGEPEPLVMGSHRLGVMQMLPPVLRVLRASVGALDVSLNLLDPDRALAATLNGSIEMALSYRAENLALDDERVLEVVTSTTPTMLFFHPGHRFERLDLITADELNGETLILLDRPGPQRAFSLRYTRRCVDVAWYEVPDVPTAFTLVRERVGVLIMSEAFGSDTPGVASRPLDHAPAVALTMIRRVDRKPSPAGRMVWEMLAPPPSATRQRGLATA